VVSGEFVVSDELDGQVAALFQALAEPARVSVVRMLSTGPWRAGKLAEAAHVSAPAMSKHLRILLETGLVTDERRAEDARLRIFRLRPEPIAALGAWLGQLQVHRDEQLASFKRHVEGEAR
jgi:DNA-binding transcriptional ArsR family regulator